ncbi:MAG: RNA polymerase sigma factor [Methylococcales bacterium]|nr:RNA polymerase sigma factor [Methylococcaceae bacterium]
MQAFTSNHEPSDNALFWNESLAEDLRIFLTGRVKCAETAADLTHETYLRLYQAVKENPPDNARALAFHIAVQLAIDYHRKTVVRERHHADVDFDSCVETISSTSAGPEQTLMARQRLGALQIALAELPVDCRTAFLLHGVDGLSYSEIAIRMDISKSMVGKHLARAMSHCAKRLEQ